MAAVTLLIVGLVAGGFAQNLKEYKDGEVTTFYTPVDYDYKRVTLRILYQDFLTFKVRACNDVHLALLQERGDLSLNLTEIVIGGWNNGRSVIRDAMQGDPLVSVRTPKVLSCVEYRTFWISWRGDNLQVGRGPVYGEQVFMKKERTGYFAHVINDVAFATGWGANGAWQIAENQAFSLTMRMPEKYGHQYLWKTTSMSGGFQAFQVKACGDIHVAASPQHGVERNEAYEFVIGGWYNSRSVIRINTMSTPVATYERKGLASCTEFRPFWVSWRGGLLALGRGNQYMKDVLITYQDENPRNIQEVSFSVGWDINGTFSISQDLESSAQFVTPVDPNTYKYATLMTPRSEFVTFTVLACSDAWIALSSSPNFGSDMIEVYLGTSNNMRSGIQVNGRVAIEVDTPDILACNRTFPFWISSSTENNTYMVGRGEIFGVETFLTWSPSNPIPHVYGYGFKVAAGPMAGTWTIRKRMGTLLSLTTSPQLSSDSTFMTIRQEYYKVISARACANVTLDLQELPGWTGSNTYRVVIGYKTNREQILLGSRLLAESYNNGLLNCEETRTFWVSWYADRIMIGRGSRVNFGTVLSRELSLPVIRALGISSNTSEATLVFRQDRGDEVIFNTTGNDDYGNKYIALRNGVPWSSFLLRACSDATILLSDYYMYSSTGYEISIKPGGSDVITIRKGGEVKQSQDASDLLKCTEHREFWVSWTPFGVIAVGRGRLQGQETIMRWTDPQPQKVVSLGFKTGRGQQGEWSLYQTIGVEIAHDTLGTGLHEQMWMTVRHRTSLVFKVAACNLASLILCELQGSLPGLRCYTISLTNTRSSIRAGFFNRVYVSRDTPSLVTCRDDRTFWVSWDGGLIILGSGDTLWRNKLLMFQDLSPFPVKAASVTTSRNVTGRFRLSLQGNFATIIEPARGLSGGAVAGIVIGVLLLIALLFFGIYASYKKPDFLMSFIESRRTKAPSPSLPREGGITNINFCENTEVKTENEETAKD